MALSVVKDHVGVSIHGESPRWLVCEGKSHLQMDDSEGPNTHWKIHIAARVMVYIDDKHDYFPNELGEFLVRYVK